MNDAEVKSVTFKLEYFGTAIGMCKFSELKFFADDLQSVIPGEKKVHEFSYNATIGKKKDHPNHSKAKIQRTASNTTYQPMLKKEH